MIFNLYPISFQITRWFHESPSFCLISNFAIYEVQEVGTSSNIPIVGLSTPILNSWNLQSMYNLHLVLSCFSFAFTIVQFPAFIEHNKILSNILQFYYLISKTSESEVAGNCRDSKTMATIYSAKLH